MGARKTSAHDTHRRGISSRCLGRIGLTVRRLTSASLWLALLVASGSARAEDARDSGDSAERAQKLIAYGHEQSDAGNFCEAWRLYHEAAGLRRTPDPELLFAIGRAAHKAGMFAQAIAALELYVRVGADEGAKEIAERWLREAESRVVRCQIAFERSGAPKLEIQGRAKSLTKASAACSFDSELTRDETGAIALLNPGWRYQLSGTAQGKALKLLLVRTPPVNSALASTSDPSSGLWTDLTRDGCVLGFSFEQAQSQQLSSPSNEGIERLASQPRTLREPLSVKPTDGPTPGAFSSSKRPSDGTRSVPTLSYVAWGSAIVALGGMTAGLVWRQSKIANWNSHDCLRDGKSRLENCAGFQQSYRRAQTWAIVGGASAAAFATAGALLWLLHNPKESSHMPVVWLDRRGLSAGYSVRFW